MKIIASLILMLAFLAVAIHGRAVPENLATLTKGLHQVCVADTGVTEDLIEKAGNGEFSDKPEFKCYLKCLLEKLNLISSTGALNFDGMLSLTPPSYMEIATKMIDDCRDITGTDDCDKAYNLNVCFYKSNPAEYFLM